MEPTKKQFYFNGVNSEIIVHTNSESTKINVSEFINNYDCELEREFNMDSSKIKKYLVNEDVRIDSLDASGNLTTSKITHILHKEGSSGNSIFDFEYNNDKFFVSNLAIYDKKKSKIIISPLDNIDQKFIIQNVGKFADDTIEEINNIELSTKCGFLVGYWLLRGGFSKLEKDADDEFICFKGKDTDSEFIGGIINQIFPNNTSFRKKSYKDFEFVILVNNDFQEFVIDKFRSKRLSPIVLQFNDDFIKGLFFSFIYCRSYISKDKNDNSYLVISNKNRDLLEDLHFILKNKFSINSKFISTNDSLSFKINKKLRDILKVGIDASLFNIDFNELTIAESKEFFVKGTPNFKIVPWYKTKIAKNEEVENSYTFKLENNKIFMLSNGMFVLG